MLRIETFKAAAQNLNASHVARHYLNVAGTAREKKIHDVITHLPYSDPLLGVRNRTKAALSKCKGPEMVAAVVDNLMMSSHRRRFCNIVAKPVGKGPP